MPGPLTRLKRFAASVHGPAGVPTQTITTCDDVSSGDAGPRVWMQPGPFGGAARLMAWFTRHPNTKDGAVSRNFNTDGRLQTEAVNFGSIAQGSWTLAATYAYDYNAASELNYITLPSGMSQVFGYDGLGRVKSYFPTSGPGYRG